MENVSISTRMNSASHFILASVALTTITFACKPPAESSSGKSIEGLSMDMIRPSQLISQPFTTPQANPGVDCAAIPPPISPGGLVDNGPCQVSVLQGVGPGGDFVIFMPQNLPPGGVKRPLITWGNGTGAIPLYYVGILSHLASHGFVVIASNSTQTGNGVEMRQGLQWLVMESESQGSPFYGLIDATRIGATGHSQGGGGAIQAGGHQLTQATDRPITSIVAIEPDSGGEESINSPILFLAGEQDDNISASQVEESFGRIPAGVFTFFASLKSGTHFSPVADGTSMRGVVTAWFRMTLMNDPQAAAIFTGQCSLCTDPNWRVLRKGI